MALHAPNKAGQKVTYVTFWPLASFWPAGLAPLAVADAALAVQQLRACALTRDREARSRSSTDIQSASSLRHSLTTSVLCTRCSGTLWRCAASGWRLDQTRGSCTAGESGDRPLGSAQGLPLWESWMGSHRLFAAPRCLRSGEWGRAVGRQRWQRSGGVPAAQRQPTAAQSAWAGPVVPRSAPGTPRFGGLTANEDGGSALLPTPAHTFHVRSKQMIICEGSNSRRRGARLGAATEWRRQHIALYSHGQTAGALPAATTSACALGSSVNASAPTVAAAPPSPSSSARASTEAKSQAS